MQQFNPYHSIAANAEELLASPTIWLTLTNRCNINCHYCFNYLTENNYDMPAEMAVGILKKYFEHHESLAVKKEYLNVLFFGGEPTINDKALLAAMDFINAQEIPCFPRLLTNGLIREEILEKLLDRLIYFQISFDGIKNNLRYTKSGSNNIHPQVIQTIKRIRAAGQPIQIRATIHGANVHNMSDVVEFAAEHEVKEVAFSAVFLDGNAKKYPVQQPIIADYIAAYAKAQERAQALNVIINTSEKRIREGMEVGNLDFPLVFLPDGQLSSTIQYASAHTEEAKQTLMGYYDMAREDIILNKEKIELMSKSFYKNREKNCQNCSIYTSCQGFNNFDTYTLNREMTARENYFCEITRQLNNLNY